MNPRLVLHLFLTDWRRLRWLLALAWMLMLLAALPMLHYDTANFSLFQAPPEGPRSYPESAFDIALRSYLGTAPEKDAVSTYAKLVLPWLLLGISASLGFHGAGWARVRPLRLREKTAAAIVGVLAFIVLPQALLIGINLARHGFGAGTVLKGILDAGLILFSLHLCSVIFGRLCGSLWRWVAGIVALGIVRTLAFLIPWSALRHFPGDAGWWGEQGNDLRVWSMTLIGLLLLVYLFRHGRRPRLKIALALLLVAVMPRISYHLIPAPGFLALRSVPRHAQADTIRPEIVPDSLYQENYSTPPKYTPLMVRAQSRGLPAGEGMVWMLAEAGPLYHDGKRLHQYDGAGKEMPPGKDVVPPWLPMPVDYVATVPFKDPEGSVSKETAERLWLDRFDLAGMTAPGSTFSLDAELLGIGCRFREAFHQPLLEQMTYDTGSSKGQIRFSKVENLGYIADFCYLRTDDRLLGFYQDNGDLHQYRCYLILPHAKKTLGGTSIVLRSEPFLSQGTLIRHIYQFNKLDESELAGAELVILAPEFTGSVRAHVKAEGLTLPPPRSHTSDLRSFAGQDVDWIRYPAGRPDPATCSLDHAGFWITRVLDGSQDREMVATDLAPFVKRFPELLLQNAGQLSRYSGDHTVGDLLARYLPESRRDEVISAMSQDGGRTLTPILLKRGWQEGAREAVLGTLRREPEGTLMQAAAYYEDPSTYPLLLDAFERKPQLDAYRVLRRLPGISEALDHSVKAITARHGRSSVADPEDASPGGEAPHLFIIPAAHGSQEAFAKIFEFVKLNDNHHSINALGYLGDLASAPPEVTNWQQWNAYLKSHQAADFRYDNFTGMWLATSPAPNR